MARVLFGNELHERPGSLAAFDCTQESMEIMMLTGKYQAFGGTRLELKKAGYLGMKMLGEKGDWMWKVYRTLESITLSETSAMKYRLWKRKEEEKEEKVLEDEGRDLKSGDPGEGRAGSEASGNAGPSTPTSRARGRAAHGRDAPEV